MSFDRQFPFVFIPFNTLLLLTEPGRQQQALFHAVDLLETGGRLLVYVMNPSRSWWMEKNSVMKFMGSSRNAINLHEYDRFYHNTINNELQKVNYHTLYDELDENGRIHRRRHSTTLRYLTSFELQAMLENADLEIDSLYETFELEPFEPESPMIIFTGIKRESVEKS